jgi:hypothetical protein
MEKFPSSSQENTESNPENRFEDIVIESKLKRMFQSAEVRDGAAALFRTLANTGISLADTIPAVGDAVSWAADAWKYVAFFTGKKRIDLTPAVSKTEAIATEGLEFISMGVMPSHWYETVQQFRREDKEKLVEAFKEFKRIIQDKKYE